MPLPFADNFLAGSLLSLLLPICLLIAILIWHVSSFMRVPRSRSEHADPESLGVEPPAAPDGSGGGSPGGGT